MRMISALPGERGARSCPPRFACCVVMSLLLSGTLAAAQRATTPKRPAGEKLSPAAQEQFRKAGQHLRAGDLESARAAALEGLKLAPESIEGYNLLGIIYGQQKDNAQSIAAFEQALRLDPRSVSTHINLGNSYFSQQKLDPAAREFHSALRLDPKNREANYNLGMVLMAQGHPDQAIVFLRHIQPPDARASLSLLQAYFSAGQKNQALELSRTISGKAKNDARVHFSLGLLLASEKQYVPAIHEFELADALQPGTFEILHNLGEAYLRNQDSARAQEILNRALLLKPDSADTLYLLAQADNDQHKDADALELLVRAHQLAPRNTDIIFLMGRLSMMQDFFEDAIQVLEEGVKIAPERADLHAALGESYFTVGKVDRAIQEFQTLIELEPSAWSYTFMGLSYRHLGRYDEARKYFNLGLKKDPRNTPCLFNLGFIEHKQGNYAGAEKLLAQALKINPDYDDALFEMAGVEMSEKKYADAIPLLRRSARTLPHPAEAYYKLATAERNLHQSEAAQRDLKIFETLSKDPVPGPYPLQHLFDFVNQRAGLSPERKAEVDLEELRSQVKQHPDRPRELYQLAETYLKLGRIDEALQTIAQLDQVSGGDPRTALNVGLMLASYARYPEAIQHFQLALTSDPASDDAKYDLANAFFQARAYQQALEVMQQLGEQARQDDAYLGLLGDVDAHLGRTAEAGKIFEKAIEKNPDNDRYALSLALLQMQAGDAAAAEGTLRHAVTRAPDSGRLSWGLGVLSVVQGRNDEAAKYFRRAVDFLPEWQTAYSALGVFYFETGQTAQARETLNRYSKLFPHGGLNVDKIEKTLENAPQANQPPAAQQTLSAEERRQFLQTAMAMIDQSP